MSGRVLSAQDQKRLKEFLALPKEEGGDQPGFHAKILAWARDPEHGSLPLESARPFADWVDNLWDNWGDEEDTVEDVFKGMVEQWCGGRTF